MVTDTTSQVPTAECPHGTRTLQLGVDDNRNGTLEAGEVDSVLTFCLSASPGGADGGTGGASDGGTGGASDGGTGGASDGGMGGASDGGMGGASDGGMGGASDGGTGGASDGGTVQTCAQQQKCTKPDGSCGDSCKVGCCIPSDSAGRCQTAVSDSLCGKGGATCSACGTGTKCQATSGGSTCGTGGGTGGGGGTVDNSNTAGIGDACTTDAECTAKSAGTFCKKSTTVKSDGTTASGQGYDYPGGFCTKVCTGDSGCPTNTKCLAFQQPLLGETEGLCVNKCTYRPSAKISAGEVPNGCREGYGCLPLTQAGALDSAGACWIDPPSADNTIGKACTASTDCGPPSLNAYCLPAANPNTGAATGWVGGACLAECGYANKAGYCGAGATCVMLDDGATNPDDYAAYCFQSCTMGGANTCRTGYHCSAVSTTTSAGICWMDCTNAGAQCSPGYTCETTGAQAGQCCKSGTDCY